MNFINKLEEMFNQLFYKVLNKLKALIPSKVRAKHLSLTSSYENKKQQLKQKSQDKSAQALNKLKKYNTAFFKKVDKAKAYPIKDVLSEKKMKAMIYLKSTPKKKILLDTHDKSKIGLRAFFKNKKTYLVIIPLISALFIKSYIDEQNEIKRKRSLRVEHVHRPDYKRFENRTFKILSLSIPLKYKGRREIHSYLTDFYIRTNTVFAKVYLDNNQHRIRDKIYQNTYRLPSSYPLKEEGKQVLKEKVLIELNSILKEGNVEGKVLEISFESPIAN